MIARPKIESWTSALRQHKPKTWFKSDGRQITEKEFNDIVSGLNVSDSANALSSEAQSHLVDLDPDELAESVHNLWEQLYDSGRCTVDHCIAAGRKDLVVSDLTRIAVVLERRYWVLVENEIEEDR